MLKLKMMLSVMMLPLVVSRLHIKAVRQPREATTASGVIMQPPPTGRHTAERDYFTAELITAKTTGRNPEVY